MHNEAMKILLKIQALKACSQNGFAPHARAPRPAASQDNGKMSVLQGAGSLWPRKMNLDKKAPMQSSELLFIFNLSVTPPGVRNEVQGYI